MAGGFDSGKQWRPSPARGCWLAALALLCTVLCPPLRAQDSAWASDSPPWAANVLQLLAYRDGELINQGTATGLGQDGTVLASAHIVAGADRLRLQTAQGQAADAEVAFVDEPRDIAVLNTGLGLPSLPLARRGIRDGQPLTLAGYWHAQPEAERRSLFPSSSRPAFVAAVVTEPRSVAAMANRPGEGPATVIAAAGRGAYGGPLINRCGELAGVLRPAPDMTRKQLWAPHTPVGTSVLEPDSLARLPGGDAFARAEEPCLTDAERAERLETEKSEAEASIAAEKARAREAEKAAQEAREASEQEKRARAEAESERENASDIVSDVTSQLDRESSQRWQIEQRHRLLKQLAVAAGALAVLVLLWLWFKRRRDLARADYALSMATAAFADCRFRGQDASGAPIAFTVSGRDLMQRPEGLILGRNPAEAAIVVADDTVSRQHARLAVDNDQLRISDLGSTGGTRLNGQPLNADGATVISGDVLEFGEVKVSLEVCE